MKVMLKTKTLGILSIFGITTLLIGAAIAPSFSSSTSALEKDQSKAAKVNVNQMLAITVPGDMNLNIAPSGDGTFKNLSDQVSVSTNNLTGYKLTLSMAGSTTSLNHVLDSTKQITNLESSSSEANFPKNKWGYSIESPSSISSYSPLPTPPNTQELKSSDGPVTSDTIDFTIASKVDTSLPSGTYSNSVKFSAVTNLVPQATVTEMSPNQFIAQDTETHTITLKGTNLDYTADIRIGGQPCTNIQYTSSTEITCDLPQNQPILDSTTDFFEAGMDTNDPTMQKMTTTISNNTSSPTPAELTVNNQPQGLYVDYYQQATLRDIRDDKIYTVVKFKDNNTWMTDNLRLGSTTQTYTLTPNDSHVARSWTLPSMTLDTSWGTPYYTAPRLYPSDDEDTASEGYHGYYGYYYNYNAATAGMDTGTSTAEATQDLCPKGWSLPADHTVNQDRSYVKLLLNQEIIDSIPTTRYPISYAPNGWSKIKSSPLQFVLSGYHDYLNVTILNRGTGGNYWSSSSDGTTGAFHLSFTDADITPHSSNDKNYGFAIRCLAL